MIEEVAPVVFNKRIAPGIFWMGLWSPEMAAEARPGQFVMIQVRKGMDPLLRRPFSICGVRTDTVLILYRVVGRGTRILSEMKDGESLAAMGPLGKGFIRRPEDTFCVLAAGGMGIAPLLFLARSLGTEKVAFLAGFGTADQVIRGDQVGLSDVPISIATDDGSAGHHGFVTDLLEDSLTDLPAKGGKVFACGPLPMLKAVAAITRSKGIPCQVSLEATMACGLGACQGCAVRAASGLGQAYWHVCQDGPVFDAMGLEWEAMECRNILI